MRQDKNKLFRIGNLLHLVVLTIAILAITPQIVKAQPATACDPEYMDALESKAYLEVQREITQNKNLIFKPDSVLEYTCFNRFVREVARGDGAGLFSETDQLGDTPVDDDDLGDHLGAVVGASISAYIAGNFEHTFLNERSSLNYDEDDVDNGSYNCSMMRQVWAEARCMNFLDEADRDSFFDFAWYESNDPRVAMPGIAECTPPGAIADMRSEAYAKESNGGNMALFSITGGEERASGIGNGDPYKDDPIITHLDKIMPPGVAGASCGHAVPTGIVVDIPSGSKYCECVCTNPSCTYSGGGESDPCTCGGSCN